MSDVVTLAVAMQHTPSGRQVADEILPFHISNSKRKPVPHSVPQLPSSLTSRRAGDPALKSASEPPPLRAVGLQQLIGFGRPPAPGDVSDRRRCVRLLPGVEDRRDEPPCTLDL